MMLSWLLDLLYPPRCMLCRTMLPNSRQPMCEDCADWILNQNPIIRRENGRIFCLSPFAYEEPLRSAIHRFKFSGCSFYGGQFGKWMAAHISSELTERIDLITWTPISFLRRWSRGYDQAKLLAAETARTLALPLVPTLKKVRNNPPQSGTKNVELRAHNVRNVYRVRKNCAIKGKNVLLVDDIITTGATLHECVKILKAAGAAQVICVTLAATK